MSWKSLSTSFALATSNAISMVRSPHLAWRGIISPAQTGVPGGEFPFGVVIKGNNTVYVSSARDREIAVTVGRALAPKGLFVIGLDVIGDYLTEVNVTSPTGFVEITQQTGIDVAGTFAQALERSIRAR